MSAGQTSARPRLLAVDWGTTALRGALLDGEGRVLQERSFAQGILSVAEGGFATVFDRCFGDWVRAGAQRCLVSGMAGSKQGWQEAPYCPCPADFADVASHLVAINAESLALPVAIVPGLSCVHGDARDGGVPDVMRGEETQVFGAMQLAGVRDGVFVLPGTHCKWVTVRDAAITGFTTYMSGEFFALLKGHSLLAKSINADAPFDGEAFAAGITRARSGGGLLHNAFGARTLSLFARMDAAALNSYLSGLVIGEELRAQAGAMPDAVILIGATVLAQAYQHALEHYGVGSRVFGAEATWAGLHALANTPARN